MIRPNLKPNQPNEEGRETLNQLNKQEQNAPQVSFHRLGGVGEEGVMHEGDGGGGALDVHQHVLHGAAVN